MALNTLTYPSNLNALAAELPPTLTPQDVARLFGCSVGTLRNMRSADQGPRYMKPAGRVIYLKGDVLAFMAKTPSYATGVAV
jgi:hypothetical protein